MFLKQKEKKLAKITCEHNLIMQIIDKIQPN